ncbi:hypothetical protein FIBSPDRAFT_827532 [Athelia psychrophila]|uniref:Uncharacterized protein n=1 Tax=Athelia psychrophila TaxID=1759441 RepID=A0A166IMB9_9AGAM|nr:hypothetical protein FIBSPDRAFT_827532 [Fibularhizoctonia sp. CBS 109695]
MSTPSARKHVIMGIGLPPTHPTVAAHLDPVLVRDALARIEAVMKDAGYDYIQLLPTPEDDMFILIAELGQKKYEGVVIGFGIRGSPELTPWFEQLLNTIAEHSPGTKFMFNTPESPLTAVEAVQRWFPVVPAQ